MTRILLPTDFSENALTAIRYALTLYKDLKCTFFLLNSYMPPVYHTEYLMGSPAQIGLGDIVQQNSQDNLEALKNTLEKEFNNPLHTFITHSALNVLSSEITRTVEAEKIDIIVMGTQGASGAKEILLGTNTVHVIKNAKCPVLVIPSSFEYEAPEQILIQNKHTFFERLFIEPVIKKIGFHVTVPFLVIPQ